mgnify:CR=1 FL=1|jgi:hypothetical protein
MSEIMNKAASESLAVNPDRETAGLDEQANSGRKGDAGQDASIRERLDRNPESKQARLDEALDESMDASDPPATTQPIHSTKPPASSGYNAEDEAKR